MSLPGWPSMSCARLDASPEFLQGWISLLDHAFSVIGSSYATTSSYPGLFMLMSTLAPRVLSYSTNRWCIGFIRSPFRATRALIWAFASGWFTGLSSGSSEFYSGLVSIICVPVILKSPESNEVWGIFGMGES